MLLLIITVAFEYSFYYTQAYIKQFHYASWSYQQLSEYFSHLFLFWTVKLRQERVRAAIPFRSGIRAGTPRALAEREISRSLRHQSPARIGSFSVLLRPKTWPTESHAAMGPVHIWFVDREGRQEGNKRRYVLIFVRCDFKFPGLKFSPTTSTHIFSNKKWFPFSKPTSTLLHHFSPPPYRVGGGRNKASWTLHEDFLAWYEMIRDLVYLFIYLFIYSLKTNCRYRILQPFRIPNSEFRIPNSEFRIPNSIIPPLPTYQLIVNNIGNLRRNIGASYFRCDRPVNI